MISLPRLSLALLLSSLVLQVHAANPVNVLFIITDQQRWDTLGCGGNKVIRTPNLDRLAKEGARFTRMYSSCPVCVPARTVMLTGRSCESNQVLTNNDLDREGLPTFATFDQRLMQNGWRGEYHGKYHSPYKYALEYSNAVHWSTGKRKPKGTRADMSEAEKFLQYIAEHVPERPLQPGEQIANMYNRPYLPDPIDGAYGRPLAEVAKYMRDKEAGTAMQIGQGFSYGCLDVPPEHTLAAWTVKEGLEALDRLKDGPFTLTVSIGPPHPPMVLPKPYYGMYPPKDMPVPESIDDPRSDSPYLKNNSPATYRDKAKVQQMISNYYGLITLDDDWIGKLLARLDELHLADNTLVIFTADHGEQLGDHGMLSKFVFYEGSAHIPLLMRLPGVIPAGTVVEAPVAQIDLHSTILDYCGIQGQSSDGRSLRPLVEGRDNGKDRIAVSEWNATAVPGYMITDGHHKLMFGRGLNARSVDALYDLDKDPQEMRNLLATDAGLETSLAEAERLKALLVGWLERNPSPTAGEVKARTVKRTR